MKLRGGAEGQNRTADTAIFSRTRTSPQRTLAVAVDSKSLSACRIEPPMAANGRLGWGQRWGQILLAACKFLGLARVHRVETHSRSRRGLKFSLYRLTQLMPAASTLGTTIARTRTAAVSCPALRLK